MSKYLYRLWIPQADIHGACFDMICEKCQDKIEKIIEEGFVLPTTVSIDTIIGLSLHFSFHFGSVELCETCATAFRKWISKLAYLRFDSDKVGLWRNLKEEK